MEWVSINNGVRKWGKNHNLKKNMINIKACNEDAHFLSFCAMGKVGGSFFIKKFQQIQGINELVEYSLNVEPMSW
jgi:hypothetical protein